MSGIPERLQAVENAIVAACGEARRPPEGVQLLAVSKTFGADAVLAAVAAGQRAFGENYVQEGVEKVQAVAEALRGIPAGMPPGMSTDSRLAWHFIGPIQSNKTRPIAEHFDWVHTVEREKIAARLSEQRPPALGPLNVCVQVNISGEASKSGAAPAEVLALAAAVARQPNLKLRGLMAIPEPVDDFAAQRAPFAAMRELFERLRETFGPDFDTLSMGMSADMRAAIVEGATIVRVGSAIFGARTYNK